MNRPGGKDKYRELTDRYADEAYKIIQDNNDTEEIFEQIQELINNIKTEAYGLRTITRKKAERGSDENLLLKRSTIIKEAIDKMEVEGKRINEQIFLSRKQFNSNDDDEIIEAINHYKTNEHLDDPDDIIESILDYNTDVLSKNENLEQKYKDQRDDKKDAVEFFKMIDDAESNEPIKWEEYLRVVKKVMTVNKGCYKDFTLAGARWKTVMFSMFQMIYMTEKIPTSFKQTKLKKLYQSFLRL